MPTPATSIIDLLVTLVNGINYYWLAALTTVTKSSSLDVAGVVDLLVSLLGELFQIFLSVRHIAQLATHGKTVEILKSDLCKIIAGKT